MRTIVALLILLAASPVFAKCGDQFYEFVGGVVDGRGEPAVGAMVGVSWSDRFGPAGPVMVRTGETGRYAIPVKFRTYSGRSVFSGDRCNTSLEKISIAAYGDSERSDDLVVDVASDWSVTVPTLKLDRPIERDPLWPEEIGGDSAGRSRDTEWAVGSEWKITIGQSSTRPEQVVTMRVEADKANSCLSGDWKRLKLVSGSYEGLSEPAYILSGNRLQILLASDICDAYDHLEGSVQHGLYRARHSVFGMYGGKDLGTAYAIRVK